MEFTLSQNAYLNILITIGEHQLGKQMSLLEVLYKNNETLISDFFQSEPVKKEIADLREFKVQQVAGEKYNDSYNSALDYAIVSHATQDVLSHSIIVAAFSFYEKALKNLLYLSDKLTEQELRNCYRYDTLKKVLIEKFSISYEALTDFPQIEELRCLNNAIKHNGSVGSELIASNSKWILDKEIKNTFGEFIRLKESPTNLLIEIGSMIKSKISFH